MSDKAKENAATNQLAGLSLGKSPSPPRPPRQPARPIPQPEPEPEEEDDFEEEDENDPFADRNAVVTPGVEKRESDWKHHKVV
jgi:hypothetical protein